MSNGTRILVNMNESEDTGPADRDRQLVEKFRDIRLSLEMSQEELSRRLIEAGLKGMNQMSVSRLEAGKRSLRFHEAVIIAEALGQSLPRLMDSTHESQTDLIRQTALEAQIESNFEQLGNLIVDTLRKQAQLGEVASRVGWAAPEISYLMAGPLLPVKAVARQAVARYFQGEFGKLPHEFLSSAEDRIQNEILERCEEAPDHSTDRELLSEYLRRVNGVDPETS